MATNAVGYSMPGRLQDVLALIQLLGLGPAPTLAPNGICRFLHNIPQGETPSDELMKHWERVAREHAEFFRVVGQGVSISLISRFFAPDRDPPLNPGDVHKLMETAINIHDRELRRQDRWTLFVPLIISIIGFAGSAIAFLVGLISSRR